MPVYDPWPISKCLAITVTLLSDPMRKNALGAKGAPGAGTAATARRPDAAHSNPMVRATEAAPAVLRKSRRVGRGERSVLLIMVYALTDCAAE